MKTAIFFIVLLFLMTIPQAHAQIKNLYLTDTFEKPFLDNPDNDIPFKYGIWESGPHFSLTGKIAGGNYRLYDGFDSTLIAYVEIKNNKYDGIYMLFDRNKNPYKVELRKENKIIMTISLSDNGNCTDMKRFDNTVYSFTLYERTNYGEARIIKFYDKKNKVIKSVIPDHIVYPVTEYKYE